MAEEAYTSHNTNRLDIEGTVKKLLTTEFVNNELKELKMNDKKGKMLFSGRWICKVVLEHALLEYDAVHL